MRSIETIRYLLPRIERIDDLDIDEGMNEHVKMLLNAEFVTGDSMYGDGDVFYSNMELTMKGHDFLAVVSNEGVWTEILKRVESAELDIDELPLATIQELGNDVMKDMLGIKNER